MLLGSLALTVSTCITGCGQLATSNRIDAIKQNANEIVLRAASDFDYSDYDLNFEEQQSFTKQKLYAYAEKNKIFSNEELNALKEAIVSDEDFVDFGDIDNLFVSDKISKVSDLDANINVKSKKLYSDLEFSAASDAVRINNKLVSNNFTDIYFEDGGNGGSAGMGNNDETSTKESEKTNENEEEYELPILAYNAKNISTSISGQIDGCSFFGLLCSKDACINLYNAFAGWINNQIVYSASGSGSPFKIIAESFKTLAVAAAVGSSQDAIAAGAIGIITCALSSLWASFCALFSSGGPIGLIIGLVIGLIGAACIGTIVAMIVYGFLGKGFAIGWKIHNIFWWEWFCGDLN